MEAEIAIVVGGDCMVEAYGELAREFEVLGLVFADGDVRGLVEEDIGRLEDGVGEETEFERGLVRRRGIEW